MSAGLPPDRPPNTDRPRPPDTDRPPIIGIPLAWNDPRDPTVWSRSLGNVRRELASLGASGDYTVVTPWTRPATGVHHWLQLTGRAEGAWPLRPEMRAVTAVYNAVNRNRRRPTPDGAWLVPLASYGLAVSGPVVTWCELTPAQLSGLWPDHTASFGYPGVNRRGMTALVRVQGRVLRRAGACCVASSWAGRSLVADHGVAEDRVKVVGYGPNLVLEPPADRDWSRPRYLFVGRDWKRKNGETVVRAFAEIRRRHPGAELHLEGEHPRVDGPGVVDHGRLDFDTAAGKDQLVQLFAAATCFVMPSWVEPFGLVYLEAATAGVASIGTTRGGTETSIGDGGLLVDPGDDVALVAAMDRMADPAVARALGQAAKARSGRFSWRLTAERVIRAVDPGYADRHGLADFL